MQQFIDVMESIIALGKILSTAFAYMVMTGSMIVKITPTLKDDNFFKPLIKFIGKYLAIDRYGPRGE